MPKPSTSASASASTSTSTCAAPRRPPKPQPSAFPESVLLDTVVYMGRCRGNETTARAETSDGYPIEVSFLVADPPALARCFIYCPVLTVDDFFEAAPEIMAADGAFLLIRAIFRRRSSLDLGISPTISIGVLSCGDDHCLVVDLRLDAPSRMRHNPPMFVFSSKTKSWSTKRARLACGTDSSRYLRFAHSKVFGVEGRSMAWVDVTVGILLCRSVAQDPEVQFIQLPSLTPVNSIRFGETEIGTMPPLDSIRDVSCRNGWFRFIEVEKHIGFSQLNDGRIKELNFGWESTMFKRRIHSDKWGWKPCGTFNSASLSLANSCSPDEKIWDYKKKKLAINSVVSSFPTLDMCSNDVVYMLAKVKHTDPNGWVLSINTRSKKLQKIAPFSGDSPLISCIFLQCGFSKHLSSAPEKYFTHERPSFDEVKTLIRTGVASFMNVHIHQVTQFATKNGLGKAAFEAVSTFERASKDIENLLSQRCRNVPSTRAKAVREKIHVAVEALDKLLNMLPSSLLDTGRSMVSVGCMDNESVVEGSISHNICIPEPYGLVY
ncbi:uncharacterized protein LOC8074283 [Sorghum bicolor]|uniref:uncharacterized protein LOC8074283 n=1 Tax=Sorghum bicolor TaxID=4558 RepID=UPI000B426B61|nr:uncharacterized protein LOC8074283 [Sorghum bicolor]|eukprot:XP_021321789.1 uncharacterized protein LOC8074283 [Sorghum bicolor]